MRWVVTGGAGQLGHSLGEVLAARGEKVHGFSRAELDVAEPAAVTSALAELPADMLSAVQTNQISRMYAVMDGTAE